MSHEERWSLINTFCDRTQSAVKAEEDLAFSRGLPPKETGGCLEIALAQLGQDPQPLLPLAGIRIVAATEAHSVEATIDASGRSNLEALQAGTYTVRADLPDALVEAVPPRQIQVNDGECSSSLFAKRKER
jgi:hypothetical protein